MISNYENNLKILTLYVLITMATIYNVSLSLDYLVGFDKKEMVTLNGLTDEQCKLVFMLVKKLKESTRSKEGGLSAEQQEILNRIIQKFAKK